MMGLVSIMMAANQVVCLDIAFTSKKKHFFTLFCLPFFILKRDNAYLQWFMFYICEWSLSWQH